MLEILLRQNIYQWELGKFSALPWPCWPSLLKKSQCHFIKVLWKAISMSTAQTEKKWSFWPFRILRRCLDLCMVIFVLTNFYRAILSTGNRGVSGSGVGPKKAHPPPQFSPRSHHSFSIPTPGHQTSCVFPSKTWGLHLLLRWVHLARSQHCKG